MVPSISEPFVEMRLRMAVAAFKLSLRAARVRRLLAKAGYRPDQPRVPAGNPDGGKWTDDLVHLVSDPEKPPKIPDERPPRIRERNVWAQVVARYLVATSTGIEAYAATHWIWEHAGHSIVAYLDEPRFLDELQRAATEPRPGYQIHHIVEQGPARREGLPESRISGWRNLVRIPTYRHWEITAWYGTRNEEFRWLTPREYLRNAAWEKRYEVGLKALRLFRVLK